MPNEIPSNILALLAELQAGGEGMLSEDPLMAQYETASKMRNTPMPQGRTVRDQYIAPNPLEVANAAIMQAQGGQGQRENMSQMRQAVGAQGNAYKALMMAKLLRDYQTGPAPTGEVGGLPQPPESIPFAQTPPWEEPWYPGVDGAPPQAPSRTRKPPVAAGAAKPPVINGGTGEW
jgi:hypothetical protein